MSRRALRKLKNQRVERSDLRRAAVEIQSMEDRPAAIVAATLVEDALEDVLRRQMKTLSRAESDQLFSGTGPLATFSAKIRIANALKFVDNAWTKDIDAIREIRNAFAHGRIHLDFATTEIVDCTMAIKTVDRHRHVTMQGFFRGSIAPVDQVAQSVRLNDPRSRFIGSCLYLAFALRDLEVDPEDWTEDEDE